MAIPSTLLSSKLRSIQRLVRHASAGPSTSISTSTSVAVGEPLAGLNSPVHPKTNSPVASGSLFYGLSADARCLQGRIYRHWPIVMASGHLNSPVPVLASESDVDEFDKDSDDLDDKNLDYYDSDDLDYDVSDVGFTDEDFDDENDSHKPNGRSTSRM